MHATSTIPLFDFETPFDEASWSDYVNKYHSTVSGTMPSILVTPAGRALIYNLNAHSTYTSEQIPGIKNAFYHVIMKSIFNEHAHAGTALRIFYEKIDRTPENIAYVCEQFNCLVESGALQFLNYPYINTLYQTTIPGNGPDIIQLIHAACDTTCSNIPKLLDVVPWDELSAASRTKNHYLSCLIEAMYAPEMVAKTCDLRVIDTKYYDLHYEMLPLLNYIEETYFTSETRLGFYISQLQINQQAQRESVQRVVIDGEDYTPPDLEKYGMVDEYLTEKLQTLYPAEYAEFKTLKSLGLPMTYKLIQDQVMTKVPLETIPTLEF